MGCTPDKDIRSHYNILLCLVLSVLYARVYATSTSLQIISYFIYSYLSAVFQFKLFRIASKITNEFFYSRRMYADFKLLSLNVRGIRSAKKRKALFMWLNKRKYDIILLQETYCTVAVEDTWRAQWQGKLFSSHGTNHSCGVMVLVRSDLEFNLKSVEVDVEGRYVVMEADVQGSNFLFVNVYAPNKVQEQCLFLII